MSPTEVTGTRLGRYRLVQRIGEGGMGVVHLGLDDEGRAVAVKVLRPHVAGDPHARERLAREVSTLRRVRHPRVAAVLDADVDCDTPYVVTQYVPAPALDAHVRAHGALDDAALARLGDGLGQALAAIHSAGVVHRDLKPANVLMLDGDPVVIDFGIAHVADDVRLTSTGLVMGTPGYLSPEVVDGDRVVPATDWWGWAATMAFAATGRPPYGRGPVEVVLDRVRRGEPDLDGVPAGLVPVLTRALAAEPEERPAPGELRAAVASLRDAPTQAVPRGRAQPATQAVPRADASPATTLVPAPTPAPRTEPAAPYWPFDEDAANEDAANEDGANEDGANEDGANEDGADYAPLPPQRSRRTGTLLAGLVAVVAAAAVVPVAAALVALAGSVLARTVDRTTGAMLRRRHERGPRRGDAVLAALSSPAHLVSAALVSLPAALLPALVGAATVFLAGLVLGSTFGEPPVPGQALPLAAGALAATLTGWWGPGGGSVRRGTRSVVRALAPGPTGAQVAVVLLLIVAGAAALVVWRSGGVPDWTPLPGPPFQ